MEKIRLSKVMSERGICSRREADRYIEQGLVLVDGEVISQLGTKVSPDASIELARTDKKTTILLNKPIGYVSNLPEKDYPEAVELLPPSHKKLNVAGRLDIDSKGLLVLTNDGALVKKLIGPDAEMEKEYLVRVEGTITKEGIQKLCRGLYLDNNLLKRAQIDQLKPNLLRFVLKEGKKRQIRRMCTLVGLHVIGLKRVRIGHIRLGDLSEGKWRYLNKNEAF